MILIFILFWLWFRWGKGKFIDEKRDKICPDYFRKCEGMLNYED